jgi:hypothetical protein
VRPTADEGQQVDAPTAAPRPAGARRIAVGADRPNGRAKHRGAARQDAPQQRDRHTGGRHDPLGAERESQLQKAGGGGEQVARDLVACQDAQGRGRDTQHQCVKQHYLDRRRGAVALQQQLGDHQPPRRRRQQHRAERKEKADERAEDGEDRHRLVRCLDRLSEQGYLEVGRPHL